MISVLSQEIKPIGNGVEENDLIPEIFNIIEVNQEMDTRNKEETNII